MIEIYRDRDNIEKTPGHSLYHIIQAIDCELEDCAERAYNLSALDTGKPKQNLWIRDAGFYLNNGISGFSMYTSYGSAVEEMVNLFIDVHYPFFVNGYRVRTQIRHGNTIPDIVIEDANGTEVAWLDITSSSSAGHIWNKDGSGWDTTDFVAELLYDTLDFTKITYGASSGIGARSRALSLSRRASVHQQHLKQHLHDRLIAAMDLIISENSVTKSVIARDMETAFYVNFPSNIKHPSIKSLFKKFNEENSAGFYNNTAREILRQFYKNDSQDLMAAMKFLSASYNEQQEREAMYIY